MSLVGCGVGVFAALSFLVGLIPLLGWINWFTTLPLAVISAAISYSEMKSPNDSPGARFTLAASLLLILVTLARLGLGGGII